jgi:hypothetical protein
MANNDYACFGPFQYGAGSCVCVHGRITSHTLSSKEAQNTDHLTNCGLLPACQNIEKIEKLAKNKCQRTKG